MEESYIEKSHRILLETTSSYLVVISAVRQKRMVNYGEGSPGTYHSNLVSMSSWRTLGEFGLCLRPLSILMRYSLCIHNPFTKVPFLVLLLVLNQWF